MTIAIVDTANDRLYFSPNMFPIYPVTMAILDNGRPYFSPNIFPIYPVTLAILLYLKERRKERNVLFNDALNTFYLRLYGVRHMVKDHSDSEKGNLLMPHRLLLLINSKGSFICTIPQTG